jgi:HPt (histidine-containing phosphotransfer) domain-containing protein
MTSTELPESLINRLRGEYTNYLEDKLEELEGLQKKEATDLERLQTICHRLAGSAGSYGLEGLSEKASYLEEKLSSDQHKAIESHIRELRQTIKNGLGRLDKKSG